MISVRPGLISTSLQRGGNREDAYRKTVSTVSWGSRWNGTKKIRGLTFVTSLKRGANEICN